MHRYGVAMRNPTVLAARLVLGGYLAIHGAQKLFGVFEGPGLDKVGLGFASMGLTPGRPMAALAGASELGGGLLTASGLADPFGPIVIAGTMAVASVVHRSAGPMAAKGGFELPLTNLALASMIAVAGPGRYRAGRSLPKALAGLTGLVAAAMSIVSIVRLVSFKPPAAVVAPVAADESTVAAAG
jgi:putative oxidoreductase